MYGNQSFSKKGSPDLFSADAVIEASNILLSKVFVWMAAGLGITAIMAFATASSPAVMHVIFGNYLVFYGSLLQLCGG